MILIFLSISCCSLMYYNQISHLFPFILICSSVEEQMKTLITCQMRVTILPSNENGDKKTMKA